MGMDEGKKGGRGEKTEASSSPPRFLSSVLADVFAEVVERAARPSARRTCGSQPSTRAGLRDVRLADLRVVGGQGLVGDRRLVEPVSATTSSANSLIVISSGLPMLTGSVSSDISRR